MKDDIRRAVTIGINECFQPIPIPNEDDWLSINEEPGQAVHEFEQTLKICITISKVLINRIHSC